MTYRVVKIEDCETFTMDGKPRCRYRDVHFDDENRCVGCRGDGTHTVDVCEIERAPHWWWSPTEQAATAGTWGHGDDRAVWVEVKP